MTTKEIGTIGEKLAYDELTGKGYAIIDTNVIVGNVEVDILAQGHGRLVVVEVKTRKADPYDPYFGIDRQKIMRLGRAGATYVKSRNMPVGVQIDVILITNHPDGRVEVEHMEDVALPPRRRRY